MKCPKCKIEVLDTEKDYCTGGSWEKCHKCGLVLDHPEDKEVIKW